MVAIFERGTGFDDALRLGRAFQAVSVWADYPIEEAPTRAFFQGLASNENAFLHVTPDALVGGLVMPLWFAPSTLMGVELFWFSEHAGDGDRLRRSFETWAANRGAATIQFSCMLTDREPALRRMYRAKGFDAVEIGFRKAV